MASLHITNGDSAGDIIKASVIDGDVLPWRDTMHDGPFPAGADLAALSQGRAHFFAGPGLDLDDVLLGFQERDNRLRSATDYDQVVLWFEHDLVDQLQLLQLLDWFADIDLGNMSLKLICIDRFAGIEPFRGLGQLNAEQIASLYDQREPITKAQMDVARAGWSAFRSSDPNDLLTFIGGDLTSLPFLKAALSRHLEEYPSSQTGLTRTERQILELVGDDIRAPGRLFSSNMDLESTLFMGDSGTFKHIATLCNGDQPLLSCTPDETFRYPPHDQLSPDAFRRQRLQLTDLGHQVLDGAIDAFDLIRRDWWLGGVHLLSDRPMWTWDTECLAFKQR